MTANTATVEQFLKTPVGTKIDADRAYGYQCKDVADAYALALFGDWVNTVRPGNGKDVFNNASPTYFTKVANNPADPNQVPPRGAIINWGWSAAVPEGHVAVVMAADAQGVTVLEQDGYTQRGVQVVRHGYTLPNGAIVIGWLVPKLVEARPTQCKVTAGDTMFSIAKQFGVGLQALINANPQVKNPNVISVGQVLALP